MRVPYARVKKCMPPYFILVEYEFMDGRPLKLFSISETFFEISQVDYMDEILLGNQFKITPTDKVNCEKLAEWSL